MTSCVVGGATIQKLWRSLISVTANSTGVVMLNVNFAPNVWIYTRVKAPVSMTTSPIGIHFTSMDKCFRFAVTSTLESAIFKSAIGWWCHVALKRHSCDKRTWTLSEQYLLRYLYWLCLYLIYLLTVMFFLFVTFKIHHPYEFIKCIYVLIDIGDKHLFIQYDVFKFFLQSMHFMCIIHV